MPDGGLRARHISTRGLITIGYDLKGFQLVGAPGWVADTYYDVDAKPEGQAPRDRTFTMLQALLVDRFKLAFHREMRELDGFALVRAGSGALGPKLQRSTVDCGQPESAKEPRCREGSITDNSMQANGAPIWSLVQVLVAHVSAPVTDETQLTDTYDIDFQWSPDAAPTGDLPSIFTALQEQLGLKLERRRVASEAFVIDRIERPTAD
jgi:uncharacterized protein (TIGR03435 family)